MWESSGPVWETLEFVVRGKDQEFTQVVLEDEVTEYLGGQKKSRRKGPVEAEPRGYRNGCGKSRNLKLASRTAEAPQP